MERRRELFSWRHNPWQMILLHCFQYRHKVSLLEKPLLTTQLWRHCVDDTRNTVYVYPVAEDAGVKNLVKTNEIYVRAARCTCVFKQLLLGWECTPFKAVYQVFLILCVECHYTTSAGERNRQRQMETFRNKRKLRTQARQMTGQTEALPVEENVSDKSPAG
jgi:hypothetical protein